LTLGFLTAAEEERTEYRITPPAVPKNRVKFLETPRLEPQEKSAKLTQSEILIVSQSVRQSQTAAEPLPKKDGKKAQSAAVSAGYVKGLAASIPNNGTSNKCKRLDARTFAKMDLRRDDEEELLPTRGKPPRLPSLSPEVSTYFLF
jgi:hypothetical protein